MSLANAYNAKRKIKLSKHHDKNQHLYLGDEGTSKQGDMVRSANRSKSWAKDERSSTPTIERSMAKNKMTEAKAEARKSLSEERAMPKPKIQGLAHGGQVKGVHHPKKWSTNGGRSEAGSLAGQASNPAVKGHPVREEMVRDAKAEHHKVLSEMRSMPKPNIKGLAFGGEADDDTMVDQIMRKHKMAFEPEHDEPAHLDDIESFDEEDPGEELGEHDMISKIMRKRNK
jgi:hypothetical protein